MNVHLPNWFDVFRTVCERGQGALGWGLPEQWVHAELYAELKRQEPLTGWTPFSTELPYVTFCPVQLPNKGSRNWKKLGAVKWVDLCLWSEPCNAWCWFEFKVRKTESHQLQHKAALQARDVFRKDVVALMGFDADLTAKTWVNPDNHTMAYWFESILKPRVENLRSGQHRFVAAYLQLGVELDPVIWGVKVLKNEILKWFSYRNKEIALRKTCPDIRVTALAQSFVGSSSLLVCEWASRFRHQN